MGMQRLSDRDMAYWLRHHRRRLHARDYMRRGAVIGMRAALVMEGVVLVVLAVANASLLALGLLDGMDEVMGCLALGISGLLALVGSLIGAACGLVAYQIDRSRLAH